MRAVARGVVPPVGRPSVQPGQPLQLTEHKTAARRATDHISPADCSAAHVFWRPGQDTLYYLKSFNFSDEHQIFSILLVVFPLFQILQFYYILYF